MGFEHPAIGGPPDEATLCRDVRRVSVGGVLVLVARAAFRERTHGETREGRGRRRDPHEGGGGRRHGAHRVPGLDRPGARQPARRAARRRAPSTRCSRTRWPGARSKAVGWKGVTSLFEGPVAIAFVRGDAAAAAKALRDFGRTNPALVLKGGLLGKRVITAAEIEALAELQPREVLLARLAGAFQAPLVKAAGLFQAFTRNFAYGVKALIDQRVEGGEACPEPSREPRRRRARTRPPGSARRPRHSEAPEAARARGPRPKPRPRHRVPRRNTRRECRRVRTEAERERPMATPWHTTDELLDVFKNMTVLELNEFLKAFEEEFGVTAAAPVAVAAAAPAVAATPRRPRSKDEFDVDPHRGRRQEDPGHQGGPGAHGPRPEGGQGPRRQRARSRCSRRSPRKTPRRPRPSSKAAGATVELK